MLSLITEDSLTGQLLSIAVLTLLAGATFFLSKVVILGTIRRFIDSTQLSWGQVFYRHKVFTRFADLPPAMVIYYGITLVPALPAALLAFIQRGASAILVTVVVLSLSRVLDAVNELYGRNPQARHRPIKGYLQVIKLFLFIMATVLVVAILLNRSPWMFLSGIGAMTAVVLLIFKDTILSLVASVQLATNDMLRVGDWIEVPQYGADGDVMDIALHTVKVQNWDKTVTTIPTYALISEGFKNWRTMPIAGGRRIMRSVFIDMSSIGYLSQAEVERLGRFVLLRDYITAKTAELATYNAVHCPDGFVANARRLTNIGTFRAYVDAYLRQHPGINQDLTLMVRQLAPTADGLPMQVYAFTNDTRWVQFEAIQSDIFDHILAIAPEMGLRIFQSPSGADFRGWKGVEPSGAGLA